VLKTKFTVNRNREECERGWEVVDGLIEVSHKCKGGEFGGKKIDFLVEITSEKKGKERVGEMIHLMVERVAKLEIREGGWQGIYWFMKLHENKVSEWGKGKGLILIRKFAVHFEFLECGRERRHGEVVGGRDHEMRKRRRKACNSI
jgi:hypothetical protein